MQYMGITLAAFAMLPAIYYFFLFRRILKTYGADLSKKSVRLGVVLASLLVWAFASQVTSPVCLALLLGMAADLPLLIIDLVLRLVNGKDKYQAGFRRWKKIFGFCVIPLLYVLVTFVAGTFIMQNVTENRYELTTDKQLGTERFRLCFLSDVHCGIALSPEKIREVCDEMSSKEIDAVILGGDLLDNASPQDEVEEMFRSFGSVKSTYGVYYIFGNHDRTGDYKESVFTEDYIRRQCEANGITVLQDDEVSFGGSNVTLIGREDYRERNGRTRKSPAELLQDTDTESFVVVADHQPTELFELAKNGADLILNGHLHAGQIFPAGVFVWLVNPEHVNKGRYLVTSGGNRARSNDGPCCEGKDTASVIVSAGFAGWSYPIKTSGLAEYCIIDITMEK